MAIVYRAEKTAIVDVRVLFMCRISYALEGYSMQYFGMSFKQFFSRKERLPQRYKVDEGKEKNS